MTGPDDVLDLPIRRIGEIPFRVAPFRVAVHSILSTAVRAQESQTGTAIHFANAYTLALAGEDPTYAELLAHPATAVFTDGLPVAWIGRRAYPDVASRWERVYGPDVMQAVLAATQANGAPSHYLVGGSPTTLAALAHTIAARWPGARIVGQESPEFRSHAADELARRDARIRDSGASVVWVGLGTPKQDWEAARLAASVPAAVLAVGAAFDFVGGTKPQAPTWMQRSGMEWAFRLASEPRRLAVRYLWGNPRFLVQAAKHPGLRRGSGIGRQDTPRPPTQY